VLVADDDRDTLLTLGILLRSEGMEVRLVRGGGEVPGMVRDFHPDVVLLDIAMPDRSGYDLAEELRDQYGKAYPILIAVTAYSTAAEIKIAERCGFDHFVPKPYEPVALLALLASVDRRER
jgi:two-component system CheB/CheR fusion protein